MFLKAIKSFKNINYKFYLLLLITGHYPVLYDTLIVLWLGELLGHIYDIISKTIIIYTILYMFTNK